MQSQKRSREIHILYILLLFLLRTTLPNKSHQHTNPLLPNRHKMSSRMEHHSPLLPLLPLTPFHKSQTPALLHHAIQTPHKTQHWRFNPRLIKRPIPSIRRIKPTITYRKPQFALILQSLPAFRIIQCIGNLLLDFFERGFPPIIKQRGDDRSSRPALREADHAVDSPGIFYDVADGNKAGLETDVRSCGVVFAPPAPGIALGVCALGGGGVEAGDVGGAETDGGGGVDKLDAVWVGGEKGRGVVVGGEGFLEGFFESAGFSVEERAGLCESYSK